MRLSVSSRVVCRCLMESKWGNSSFLPRRRPAEIRLRLQAFKFALGQNVRAVRSERLHDVVTLFLSCCVCVADLPSLWPPGVGCPACGPETVSLQPAAAQVKCVCVCVCVCVSLQPAAALVKRVCVCVCVCVCVSLQPAAALVKRVCVCVCVCVCHYNQQQRWSNVCVCVCVCVCHYNQQQRWSNVCVCVCVWLQPAAA